MAWHFPGLSDGLHRDFGSLRAMPPPMSPTRPPTVVIFDLGGVLIDWDPRYLYRRLFTDADAMESFLAEVTTPAWNAEQDAGRTWAEAVAMLAERHPEQRDLIEAYHHRWSEMLAGAIEGTVAILDSSEGRRATVRTQQLVGRNIPDRSGNGSRSSTGSTDRDLRRRRRRKTRRQDLRTPRDHVWDRTRRRGVHRRQREQRRGG